MRFRLDHKRKKARLVASLTSGGSGGAAKPLLPVGFGSASMQAGGNMLVAWGTSGLVTDVRPDGRAQFTLNLPNASYRAAYSRWVGRPGSRPLLAARRRRGGIDAWASGNGATEIAHCLLTGADPGRLRPTGALVRFADLETRLRLSRSPRFVAVQALDARGRELGRSRTRSAAGR